MTVQTALTLPNTVAGTPFDQALSRALVAAWRWPLTLNGHDPFAYLRDALERLPTQPASRIDELLPHRWEAKR